MSGNNGDVDGRLGISHGGRKRVGGHDGRLGTGHRGRKWIGRHDFSDGIGTVKIDDLNMSALSSWKDQYGAFI